MIFDDEQTDQLRTLSNMQRVRLLDLHRRLKRGEIVSADDHQQAHGIGRRMAFHDRKILVDRFHAPLESTTNGWRYTDTSFNLAIDVGSPDEIALLERALVSGAAALSPAEQITLREVVRNLRSVAPDLRIPDNESARHDVFGPDIDPKIMHICRQSVKERYVLGITYRSPRSESVTRRDICPHHIHEQNGELYLIAYCLIRNDDRYFNIGGIEEAMLRGDDAAFQRWSSDEIEKRIGDGMQMDTSGDLQTVCVRFDAYQAHWIRARQYHISQTLEDLPDGGVLLTMRLRGLPAVRRWVMQFGKHAEVLEPTSLRAEVCDEIEKLKIIYSDSIGAS